MVKNVWLKRPELQDQQAVEEMISAFHENGEDIICGSALLDRILDYPQWLNTIDAAFDSNEHAENWVPFRTFLIMEDEKPVGFLDFRLALNDFLKVHGHIGYSIHPMFRNRGIASTAFNKALFLAKEWNIRPIRMGIFPENLASQRVIEKNGGKLLRQIDESGKTILNYEIEL